MDALESSEYTYCTIVLTPDTVIVSFSIIISVRFRFYISINY